MSAMHRKVIPCWCGKDLDEAKAEALATGGIVTLGPSPFRPTHRKPGYWARRSDLDIPPGHFKIWPE